MPFLLVPLDRAEHDVDAFSSGNEVCDDDLRKQSRNHRNRTLVMADGRRIIAFSRYSYVLVGSDKSLLPYLRIEFVARDIEHGKGAGMEIMLRTFIRIAQDPKASDCKGILIDSLNCGDAGLCAARWRFFTGKFGFVALSEGSNPYGYAFIAIDVVRAIAEKAKKKRE